MQQAQDQPIVQVVNLERAEEDDEFEEFERDDYAQFGTSLSDSIHWEDNWDTANANDEFTAQLRAELEKNKVQ